MSNSNQDKKASNKDVTWVEVRKSIPASGMQVPMPPVTPPKEQQQQGTKPSTSSSEGKKPKT